MHSTYNLNDGYMGGGKRIINSVKKYGVNAHKKEILEFHDSREALREREREIVNEKLLENKNCLNLALGGGGGFSSRAHMLKACSAGAKAVLKILRLKHIEKLKTDEEYRKKYCKIMSDLNSGEKNSFYGKKHKPETIAKMKKNRSGKSKGKSNSQFGTMWITDGVNNTKILKTEKIPAGWKKGRVVNY